MAAIKRVKKKDHEKLSDSNVQHVIELLEADKPITKKDACEILNISYNTSRLNNIIEGHKARIENDRKQREKLRGKPASPDEISTIVSSYLHGNNVTDIAKSLFRSASFVKAIILRLGVPQKPMGDAKFEVAILPEQCVSEEFEVGQTVWSAKYHSPCEIIKEMQNPNLEKRHGSTIYKIYVMEPLGEVPEFYPNIKVGGFYAYSPAHNLGNLEHLKEYNVRINY